MIQPRPSDREARRLEALAEYDVLDTPREASFDALARLASEICETPIAVVNLIGAGRQFFKAEVGLGVRETPLDTSFCVKAMLEEDFLIVPDTTQDPRFDDSPLVTSAPHLRFYAGALLKTADGLPIGTLCVLGTEPKQLSDFQQRALRTIADQVMTQLNLRLAIKRRAETEARQQAIVGSATDYAIIATGLDGRITEWNSGAEAILGWSAAEMIGHTARRFFTPEDRAAGRIETEMRTARETGRAMDERWHLGKDGARFWASGVMMPLRTDSGDTIGYLKVMRDRTDERRREQRLALLARVAAGLLDAQDPDAVLGPVLEQSTDLLGFDESYSYILTPDCEHLHLTHSVGASDAIRATLVEAPFDLPICGIVAQTRQPVIIANLQQTTDPRFAIGRACGYDAFAAFPVLAGDKLHGVMSFAARSRSAFDQEAVSFFATLARYVAVVRARIDADAALHEAAETLELRVEERTRELRASQEALQQAQKMEAVGQLTGGVAHDFNNLLTVIQGSVDLLRRPNLSEEKRVRYVDAIADTAGRATKLTAQLLAFARRQSLTPEVFDVGDGVRKVADMVATLSGPRIRIVADLPEVPCYIDADKSQFDTAVVNLAINARDAMNGEGTLKIGVRRADCVPAVRERPATPGAFVAIRVEDTGCGVAPEHLDKIFEPFFTTKEVGKGTGLGLSQVFGFAHQSGGEIVVESTENAGTAFTLYLPGAGGPAEDDAALEPAVLVDGHGLCVLLVEDNPDVGRFARQALSELGYSTIWAADGAAALAELDAGAARFDIVFTDVIMPGLSGIELGQEIRRRHPALPVVLTSGYSHVLAENGSYGFDLLQKPYSIEELSRILRKAAAWTQAHGHG